MATHFGEIVELNSRSFVTDGEEWSFDDRYSIQTENEDLHNQGKPFEYLLIACGKVLSDFASAYLISEDTQTVNRYNIVLNPSDSEFNAKKKFTSTLYQLSKNTLLFVCEQLPHLYFAHHLLIKIRPYIETAGHTVILTADNMSSYKPRSTSQAFLRCLSTKACTLAKQASMLELPNTISGLPAAVMSWCQAKNKSAVMYIVYSDSFSLDSITAQPVLQLIKTFHFLALPTSSTDILKQFLHRAQLQHSNLYL